MRRDWRIENVHEASDKGQIGPDMDKTRKLPWLYEATDDFTDDMGQSVVTGDLVLSCANGWNTVIPCEWMSANAKKALCEWFQGNPAAATESLEGISARHGEMGVIHGLYAVIEENGGVEAALTSPGKGQDEELRYEVADDCSETVLARISGVQREIARNWLQKRDTGFSVANAARIRR